MQEGIPSVSRVTTKIGSVWWHASFSGSYHKTFLYGRMVWISCGIRLVEIGGVIHLIVGAHTTAQVVELEELEHSIVDQYVFAL
jgi:hypothetical protein